jgi:hypothetical protein
VVQLQTCGGNRSLGVNPAAAVLHAVADLPLVNIQADVIHRLHGGASLVFLIRSAEFSFFYTKRSSFDLYIHTNRDLALIFLREGPKMSRSKELNQQQSADLITITGPQAEWECRASGPTVSLQSDPRAVCHRSRQYNFL